MANKSAASAAVDFGGNSFESTRLNLPSAELPRLSSGLFSLSTTGWRGEDQADGAAIAPRESIAADAREKGREAASKVTEAEFNSMVTRHRDLALRKVRQAISKSEALELQLLRWELDRIEDSRVGPSLDMLGAALRPRVELAREVSKLVEELRTAGIGERHHGGRKR